MHPCGIALAQRCVATLVALGIAAALGACDAGGTGGGPSTPPTTGGGERGRVEVAPETAAPIAVSGDTALRDVAARTGLVLHRGEPAPAPESAGDGAPPEKVLARIADAARVPCVVDTGALAERRGGIVLTRRFLVAGAADDVVELVRALDAEDPAARSEALVPIGERAGALRGPLLAGVLRRDEDAGVRAEAAALLGEERDGRCLDDLVAALGDDDEFVRQSARASLLLWGDGFVRPTLLDASRTGSARVRELARAILEENLGVPLDPDAETAAPAEALVVRDLEGRTTGVVLRAGRASTAVTWARGVVTGCAEGVAADAGSRLAALAASGVSARGAVFPFGEPGMRTESDRFVVVVRYRDGSAERASGDLRGAPDALRRAVESALDAAAGLAPAAPAAAYLAARAVSPEEVRITTEAGVPPRDLGAEEEERLADALEAPGLAVECTPERASALVGDEGGPVLVRAVRGCFDVWVLRGPGR